MTLIGNYMSSDERTKVIQDAKRKITEGSLTIWNARLDMLTQAGDVKGVHDLLRRSAEAAEGDNCGNNCNCGREEMLASDVASRGGSGPKVR